jgi:hypothetical protein
MYESQRRRLRSDFLVRYEIDRKASREESNRFNHGRRLVDSELVQKKHDYSDDYRNISFCCVH